MRVLRPVRACLSATGVWDAEHGLERLGFRWLALTFFAALLLRLGIAQELASTILYQRPQLDAMEFVRWANAIAGGDFGFPSYPTHGPVYPFFLGGLLALFDGSFQVARWFQCAVGAFSCVLTALVATRCWNRRAGLAAGLLLAAYGPLAFAETALWEEVLLIFLLIASLWTFTHPRRSPGTAAATGLLLGLAIVVRPTALILLPGYLLLIRWLRGWRKRWWAAAALVVSCALIVGPVVAVASQASGTFLFIRGFGAINLWIGNDPAGSGAQNARLGGAWDRLESEPLRRGVTEVGELEGYYLSKTLKRIREQPWAFVRVLASKVVWMFQAEEIRDNHSFYFFRARSLVLRSLPGFGLLLALAGCGCFAAWREKRWPPVVIAYLLLMAVTGVIALVGLRYRMPVVPAVAMFAGLGLSAAVDRFRQRRRRDLLVFAGILVGGLVIAHLRHHPPTHNLAEEWALTGSSLQTANRLDEAEAAFRQAIAEDPESALGWDGVGRVQVRRGELDEARQAFQKAVAVDPDFRRSHYHLGAVLKQMRRLDEAIAEFRTAVRIGPRYLLALAELGPLLLERGELEEASRIFLQTLAVDPSHPGALLGLARIAGAQRRPAEGVTSPAGRRRRLRGIPTPGWRSASWPATPATSPAPRRPWRGWTCSRIGMRRPSSCYGLRSRSSGGNDRSPTGRSLRSSAVSLGFSRRWVCF
ncbi:MAG: tetratricopeptide repeat protein [bacterium]|nr:tetratricopeptide repeat protein [bacterium]